MPSAACDVSSATARVAGRGRVAAPMWRAEDLDGSEAATALLLHRYIDGWAAADCAKIYSAVAGNYRFHDPLVGRFSRYALDRYFDELHDRFSCPGGIARADVTFVLHGPMGRPSTTGELQFWREAPRLGLTGASLIAVGKLGVIAETVVYDLNLAAEVVRSRRW